MMGERPFVVTVASEKGGVGKTTLSTNLAVYLKALREDLPVTIASFDNHFTVDSMFAIGGRRGGSVASLFSGASPRELSQLGEYGVQFLASDHGLVPPDDDPFHLSTVLAGDPLPGILVLDTRPVLDYFTRNALLAADLVIVPVKDRPSLMNAASLHRILREEGRGEERLWILPSLVDRRLRLRGEMGMAEFLASSARERGYRVIDVAVTKSPRVEGLTTGFSSRVHPVITHASDTAVHRQFRQIAEFVLARREESAKDGGEALPSARRSRRGRLDRKCPACGRPAGGDGSYLFQALGGRRLGVVHVSCLSERLDPWAIPHPPEEEGTLVLTVEGEGFCGPEGTVSWLLIDPDGGRGAEGRFRLDLEWGRFLREALGRPAAEAGRDYLLLFLLPGPPERLASVEERPHLASLRRRALREAAFR